MSHSPTYSQPQQTKTTAMIRTSSHTLLTRETGNVVQAGFDASGGENPLVAGSPTHAVSRK